MTHLDVPFTGMHQFSLFVWRFKKLCNCSFRIKSFTQ